MQTTIKQPILTSLAICNSTGWVGFSASCSLYLYRKNKLESIVYKNCIKHTIKLHKPNECIRIYVICGGPGIYTSVYTYLTNAQEDSFYRVDPFDLKVSVFKRESHFRLKPLILRCNFWTKFMLLREWNLVQNSWFLFFFFFFNKANLV